MIVRNVRDLLTNRLGVPTRPRLTLPVITAAPLVATALKQDAARVAILFVNVSGFQIFLTPQDGFFPPSANFGIKIEPNGGAVSVLWDEDGEVTAWEWRAAGNGGAGLLYIVETIIDEGRQTAAAPAA